MIGGSSDVDQESMGAFQEFPQVCKYWSILLLCILFRVQWFEKALFAIITKKKEKKTYSQDRQLNPFTPKISLVILITVCFTILMMSVWRIWCWINQ